MRGDIVVQPGYVSWPALKMCLPKRHQTTVAPDNVALPHHGPSSIAEALSLAVRLLARMAFLLVVGVLMTPGAIAFTQASNNEIAKLFVGFPVFDMCLHHRRQHFQDLSFSN